MKNNGGIEPVKNKNMGVVILTLCLLAIALFGMIFFRLKRETVPLIKEPERKVVAVKPKEAIVFEETFERKRFEEMEREGRVEVISEEEKEYMERIKTESIPEED